MLTNTSRCSTCCAANVYIFVYILIGANIVPLKWPSAITRLTAHFTYGLMSDFVICVHRIEFYKKGYRIAHIDKVILLIHSADCNWIQDPLLRSIDSVFVLLSHFVPILAKVTGALSLRWPGLLIHNLYRMKV